MTKLFTALLLLFAITALVTPQQGGSGRSGGTGVVRRAAAGGSTLNDGLVSFWKLGEATDTTRNDSVGTNHLADDASLGNVTQVAGKVGNAARFITNGTLSIADNASLSFTTSFSGVAWVNFTSLSAGQYPGIIAKWSSGQQSYLLYQNGDSNRLGFVVSSTGSNSTEAVASSFGALSTATWYFVFFYFDDTANTIGISVNDGTVNTAAFASSIFDSTADFRIGNADSPLNGVVDATGVWSRKLTVSEVTELCDCPNGKEPTF